jgi:hypothetical protein
MIVGSIFEWVFQGQLNYRTPYEVFFEEFLKEMAA